MKVVVLGAGVIGTTSAWFLAKSGHEVTVIERRPGAGLETSFANGGQISVGHAEPWATPGAIRKILKWLGREDAPLPVRHVQGTVPGHCQATTSESSAFAVCSRFSASSQTVDRGPYRTPGAISSPG